MGSKAILQLATIGVLLGSTTIGQGQTLKTWGVKVGTNFTNQVYENVPTLRNIPSLGSQPGRTDTSDFGGHFNRTGISVLLYQEFMANRKISLLVGLGYRQRGFVADQKYYRRQSGLVEDLPEGEQTNNRLDNAALDLAVKLRKPKAKFAPYLLLGNRLDCNLNVKSDFWGEDYQVMTRFEISPFAGIGTEIPLGGWQLFDQDRKKLGIFQPEATRLTVEIEINPGIMNVHVGEMNPPRVNGAPPPVSFAPFTVQKMVRNQSFGINVGIRF
jgi:hypothetical protein